MSDLSDFSDCELVGLNPTIFVVVTTITVFLYVFVKTSYIKDRKEGENQPDLSLSIITDLLMFYPMLLMQAQKNNKKMLLNKLVNSFRYIIWTCPSTKSSTIVVK